MKITQRARRSAVALAAAVAIGGSGVAVGAAAAPAAVTASAPAAATEAGRGTFTSYANVVRQVLPSVVLISTTEGLGSGVVLDRSGDIVTNAHVAGDATTFQVQVTGDPAPRTATLVGRYPPDDLAVIKVADPSGLQPAQFGDSAAAQAGDVVLAVGNPLGLAGSVTSGIISATGRVVTEPADAGQAGATLPDAIQTSAPINPGNSGGALVTAAGKVIGIPTLTAAGSQDGSSVQGIGFAIPSNLARDIAGQLIRTGAVTHSHRAAIGAQVDTVAGPDGTAAGTGIVAVTGSGPADRAGLRPGDVITAAGGTPVPDTQTLASVLAGADPGDRLTLSVTRGGQTRPVPLTLGELPAG
ncbi:MAG TPA: trypsin-like peptidase domain-containing protein [Trebonia sp.]